MKVTGPTVWNCVPDYIQKLTSIHSFKSKFKAYLIDQYDNNRSQNTAIHISNNTNSNTNGRNFNNNYGLLSSRPTGVPFQSRWNDGQNNLI
jgi:hypothetical protein